MKHVFVINSHTTFLTAMGTVEYLKLKDKDVIFIYTRNYRNEVTHVTFKVVEGTNITEACRNIGKDYDGYIHKVDDFIDQNIDEKYNLYVPHLWNYFFQLLYTNKKCRRVSYVQEGGPAQTKVFEYDVPLVERIKSFIRHTILSKRTFECKWYKRGTLYKQLHVDAYALNDNYFRPMHPRTHIVQWPPVKFDMIIDTDAPIFVFDGHVANGLVEAGVYLKCCEKIILENAKPNNYVKFHPAQKKEERETILNYFKQNKFNVMIMRDDIPTEYVIIQFKNLTFIGFTSSLLYYAHDNGHTVVCYEKQLTEASETYHAHIKTNGFQTYSETYLQRE